ncbi:amidohydrolase [Coniella lustricola]|uniref:Amidohydrolase n=1 Tax=Coniella lustricola TaxID=2025994 RepID=A0A2T3A2F5_9PEZI|nr:amidohydrolase [Coniella lustricola]
MLPTQSIPAAVTKPWLPPRQQRYVLTDINIVDTVEGRIRPPCSVITSDGYIVSVSPEIYTANFIGDDRGDTIFIDCTGKYLCPGLIDAHVHLTSVPGEPDLRSTMSVPGAVSLLRQPFWARAMLERGFTTARDCGGASLALKEAIAEGVFPGPRLFIAGYGLSQTGGHGDRRRAHDLAGGGGCCGNSGDGAASLSMVADGVPAVLEAAREQLRQGADFIKLMVGGGVASPTDKLASVQYTLDEIHAAVQVAEAADTFATAHAYTPRAIQRAVNAGVKGIEHGNYLDKPTARLMAAQGVYLTPTLVTYAAMADPKYSKFLPVANREKNDMVLHAGLDSIKLAHEAGVTMCYGSDLLGLLGVEQLGEFGLRAKVLSSAEVLRHATVNPAKMLGQEDRLGRVDSGFVADLLVLNANPLKDVTVLEKPGKHLLAVMKEGRVVCSRWSKLPVDAFPAQECIE